MRLTIITLLNLKTMETKQTALEWLQSKLNLVKPTDFCSIETIKDWIEQAKAMEKEQIAEAFNNSYWFIDGQQYYEKTYGK